MRIEVEGSSSNRCGVGDDRGGPARRCGHVARQPRHLPRTPDATGVIAGSVTADHGEVRALRVKAHDTVHRIAYTVYTQDGRYRIFNLPPSTYDVSVVEEAFESPTATVEVSAGATTTVDIALDGARRRTRAGRRGRAALRPSGTTAAGRLTIGRWRSSTSTLSTRPIRPATSCCAPASAATARPASTAGGRATSGAGAGRSTACSTSTAVSQTWLAWRAADNARPRVGRGEGTDHRVPDLAVRAGFDTARPRARPAGPRRGRRSPRRSTSSTS